MEEKYMKKAIELAEMGEGFVHPNPVVGAVIVKNDKVIGEGFHKQYGGNHAEINAIESAESLGGATIYVTLEPCCHYGKTPPCTEAIIKSGIQKVVIGILDPNPLVSGKGVEILRQNGIEVIVGVLEKEIRKLNEIFIHYISEKRPFVIMKTAMTLDGKIATKSGDSKWISNEVSRNVVHEIRNQVMGIVVGINTVLLDDPKLNTRLKNKKGKDPHRIIFDTHCKTPFDSNVVTLDSESKTYICVGEDADSKRVEKLKDLGCKVVKLPTENGVICLKSFIKYFGDIGFDSLLVEGGATLNYSFLKAGLVNKMVSFIAPKIVGGESSKTPVGGEGINLMRDAITLKDLTVTVLEDNLMIEGYIERS